MTTIGGFTPLVLALPVAVKPYPRFIQKGTTVIPAIQGFDPIIFLMPIQGIFRALSPKVLETTLPSLVIISLKMISLVPNLQT